MKMIPGLMLTALAVAVASAPVLAQPPVAASAPKIAVAAPTVAVSAPAIATTVASPAIATTIATPAIRTNITAPAVATTITPVAVVTTAPQVAPPPVPPAPPAPPDAPAVAATAPVAPVAAMARQARPPATAPVAPVVAMARQARPPEPPAPPDAEAVQKPPAPPAPPKPAKATQAPQPPPPPDAPVPPGRERIEPDPVNIRFEVTISYQAGTGAPVKRTALLTVANNTGEYFDSGRLRSGNNVPVPTTTLTTKSEDGKETPADKPMVSYQYRSVGLNVDVQRAAVLSGNRVRATLNVEFSGMDEKSQAVGSAPSFPTFSQRIGLYLENGKPVVVAQSSDFVENAERKQTVEVKATILR